MNDWLPPLDYFDCRPTEAELIKLRVVDIQVWKLRTCKHGRFPCKECGTKHYDNCECGFCR